MRFLCLDSSSGCALALVETPENCLEQENGRQITLQASNFHTLATNYYPDSRAHAEKLPALLAKTVKEAGFTDLSQAKIDYVVVGKGPAPFTGLRAGLAIAYTLGYTLNKPVLAVSSLAVIARQAFDVIKQDSDLHPVDNATKIMATADARRKELYAAIYQADGTNGVQTICAPTVNKANALAEQANKNQAIVCGVGVELYPESFVHTLVAPLGKQIDASVLARLAYNALIDSATASEDIYDTAPMYLRRPDIHNGYKTANKK